MFTLPAGMGTSAETAHPLRFMLNQWAGSDLQANLGERVTLDYYIWLDQGKLATRSTISSGLHHSDGGTCD